MSIKVCFPKSCDLRTAKLPWHCHATTLKKKSKTRKVARMKKKKKKDGEMKKTATHASHPLPWSRLNDWGITKMQLIWDYSQFVDLLVPRARVILRKLSTLYAMRNRMHVFYGSWSDTEFDRMVSSELVADRRTWSVISGKQMLSTRICFSHHIGSAHGRWQSTGKSVKSTKWPYTKPWIKTKGKVDEIRHKHCSTVSKDLSHAEI